jgi:broad specificity phosphatase PhoE
VGWKIWMNMAQQNIASETPSESHTRLILVRHGHTGAADGPDPIMMGWTDLPLTPRGEMEAEAVRDWLLRQPPAVAIYTSSLARARQTAAKIERAVAGPLIVVDELREINCGEMDGWRVSEVQSRHPEIWQRNMDQNDEEFRWPGGESYREVRLRSFQAITRISSAHHGERVVVVTHTGVIAQLVGAMHGIQPARWSEYRPGSGSITELECQNNRLRLIRFDQREHLGALAKP